MKWLRKRKINGDEVVDYVPRNLLTVRTDSSKSVEVYSIKKVTPEDSGTYKCEITETSGKRTTKARVLRNSHSDIQQKEAPSEAVSEDTFPTAEVYIACCVGFA
jgi:hypothetical protein